MYVVITVIVLLSILWLYILRGFMGNIKIAVAINQLQKEVIDFLQNPVSIKTGILDIDGNEISTGDIIQMLKYEVPNNLIILVSPEIIETLNGQKSNYLVNEKVVCRVYILNGEIYLNALAGKHFKIINNITA